VQGWHGEQSRGAQCCTLGGAGVVVAAAGAAGAAAGVPDTGRVAGSCNGPLLPQPASVAVVRASNSNMGRRMGVHSSEAR
jgi:hypothetical protein